MSLSFIKVCNKFLSGVYYVLGTRDSWEPHGPVCPQGLLARFLSERDSQPFLQMGKLRLSKLSLAKVMELVKAGAEIQTEVGFESRLLDAELGLRQSC